MALARTWIILRDRMVLLNPIVLQQQFQHALPMSLHLGGIPFFPAHKVENVGQLQRVISRLALKVDALLFRILITVGGIL